MKISSYFVVHSTRVSRIFNRYGNSKYILNLAFLYQQRRVSTQFIFKSALNRYENSPFCNRYAHLLTSSLIWACLVYHNIWICVKLSQKVSTAFLTEPHLHYLCDWFLFRKNKLSLKFTIKKTHKRSIIRTSLDFYLPVTGQKILLLLNRWMVILHSDSRGATLFKFTMFMRLLIF